MVYVIALHIAALSLGWEMNLSQPTRTGRYRRWSGPLTGAAALVTALAAPALHAQAQPAGADNSPPGAAVTQQNPIPGPTGEGSPAVAPSPGQPGWAANLFTPNQPTLLGDIYGLRTVLGRYGVSLGLQEISELSGNPTGGIRQGASYRGVTILSLGLDTAKAFGWEGGTFNVSALQIHGRSITQDNLQVLHTSTSIEALRSTRLWEIWYQQTLLDGRLDAKVGQQSVDQEFMTTSYGGLFINSGFGYPLVPAADQYAGGPAYPLASLGLRLRARPAPDWTVLAGVFNDNPPGGPFDDDSQVRGASQSGTRFNTNTGALVLAEVQYALNAPGTGPDGKPTDRGLPGTYKLGGWYDSGQFPDRRRDTLGLSLADPASAGDPRQRRGNFGLYGVADQMIWRADGDSPKALGAFLRMVGAPGDRNLLNFSMNAGLTLKAPFPGRDDDTVGIGYGFAKISPSAILFDQDIDRFAGPYPVRGSESMLELTYQAQVAPWWAVQPAFQYYWTPGGGTPDPLNNTRRIGNAAVFTLRTNITF